MKEPTYSQALIQAWHITWHNKILWILGLLSIFLGQFGFSDLFGRFWLISAGNGGTGLVLPWFSINWPGGSWGIVGAFWIGLIVVSLFVLLVFLSIASQGALISYAYEWFKDNGYANVSKSWGRSLKNFWRLLGVHVIRKVLLFALLLLFAYSLKTFLVSNVTVMSIVLAAILVFVLFFSLLISIMLIFTSCYVVIDGKGLMPAFGKAWGLFSRHVLVSFEIGFLLMLFNFVLIALILFGSFIVFLPSVFIWLLAGMTNIIGLITLGYVVGIFLWIVLVVFMAAFFNAFTTSVWVYLFSKMHHEGVASRLAHWFKHSLKL